MAILRSLKSTPHGEAVTINPDRQYGLRGKAADDAAAMRKALASVSRDGVVVKQLPAYRMTGYWHTRRNGPETFRRYKDGNRTLEWTPEAKKATALPMQFYGGTGVGAGGKVK